MSCGKNELQIACFLLLKPYINLNLFYYPQYFLFFCSFYYCCNDFWLSLHLKKLQKSKLFARFLQGFLQKISGGSTAKHTFSHVFARFRSFCSPMIPCAAQALPFHSSAKVFHFSVKHLGHHPIYRKFMWEPSVYIILHVWLLRKCNDCQNVELLRTWGMLMRNLLNFAYCNVICKSEVCQQNQWEIAK